MNSTIAGLQMKESNTYIISFSLQNHQTLKYSWSHFIGKVQRGETGVRGTSVSTKIKTDPWVSMFLSLMLSLLLQWSPIETME